jgi:hypothetical protein
MNKDSCVSNLCRTVTGGKFWVWMAGVFNLKSEIEMGKLRQDVGAETPWKNRSHTRSGLVRFFQGVCAQQIGADWPFLFRISGLSPSGSSGSGRDR